MTKNETEEPNVESTAKGEQWLDRLIGELCLVRREPGI